MCQHQPTCPSADAVDRDAARVVACLPRAGLEPALQRRDRLRGHRRAAARRQHASRPHRGPARARPRGLTAPSAVDRSPSAPPTRGAGTDRCRTPPRRRRLSPRTPPAAGRRRPGCGRRTRRRCGAPAASTSPPGSTPAGYAATARGYGVRPTRRRSPSPRCAARCASGLSPAGHSPRRDLVDLRAGSRSSRRRTGRARRGPRSRSARPSACPATGNDIVGAWKP